MVRRAGAGGKAAGAQVLAVVNASPFHLGKAEEREQRMAERARAVGLPLLYAHLVGGQDEVVFDGASFALDAQGTVRVRAPSFEEALPDRRRSTATRPRCARRRLPSHGGAGLGRRWSSVCATTGQERFSRRHHRPVGRHRFGAGAGDRGRRAGRRQGARGDDAVALHRRHLVDRRPRHGRSASACATTRSPIAPMFDAFRAELAPAVRRACRRTPPRKTSRPASAARC